MPAAAALNNSMLAVPHDTIDTVNNAKSKGSTDRSLNIVARLNENLGINDAAKVKKKRTKRQTLQQQSAGTNALRIPLNTGGSTGKASGLNIPK